MKFLKRYRIVYMVVLFIHGSCNINKWDLPDKSNESIPSYAISISQFPCIDEFKTSIFAEDDSRYITCIETPTGKIQMIRIQQDFDNEQWTANTSLLLEWEGKDLKGIVEFEEQYVVLYKKPQGIQTLALIDKFTLKKDFTQFNEFIDTSYNKVNATNFHALTVQTQNKEILLFGEVSSQGTSYSAVLAFDMNLNPIWIKTYLKNAVALDITCAENDSFLLIQKYKNELNLILDDSKSNDYRKYVLAIDTSFVNLEMYQKNENVYLLSTNIIKQISSLFTLHLTNKSAFVEDVKAYPVTIISGILDGDQVICSGIIDSLGKTPKAFVTNVRFGSSDWCNIFDNANFERPLSVLKAKGKGYLFFYIAKQGNQYFPFIVRTDAEGATFDNAFNFNCL